MKKVIPLVLIASCLAACSSHPRESTPTKETSGPAPVAALPPPSTPAPIPKPPAPAPVLAANPDAPPAPAPAPSPSPANQETAAAPAKEATPEKAAPAGLREVFPHVRVDLKAKEVQFDGIVPIDAHDEKSPWVFLEVVACTPDTKEHEALVMTEAKASHVHAALLLIGLQPGSPGKWTFENKELKPIAPKGDEVRITLSYHAPDGAEKSFTPQQMIVNAQSGNHFGDAKPGKWVFAGSQIVSRMGKDVYDADGAGTLLGLTTFGSETIAWSELISPDAATEEPVWVADKDATPPAGTPITVTIRPAK
jgi:hypothetical protein